MYMFNADELSLSICLLLCVNGATGFLYWCASGIPVALVSCASDCWQDAI